MDLISKDDDLPVAFLGNQSQIEGTIQAEGILLVQGKWEGEINCHQLVVTREGRVEGKIFCQLLEIWGAVEGFSRATKTVIQPSARFRGCLMAEGISIAPGAILEGAIIFPHLDEEEDDGKKSS